MRTRLLALSVALLGAILAGCAAAPRPYLAPGAAPTAADPANVHLYLSNQSTGLERVVLAVYVDGALTVRRSMKSVFVDAFPCAHGFPDEIPLRLPPGPHEIRVVAEGTGASAETRVLVSDAEPVHVDAAFHIEGCCGEPTTPRVTTHASAERPGFC